MFKKQSRVFEILLHDAKMSHKKNKLTHVFYSVFFWNSHVQEKVRIVDSQNQVERQVHPRFRVDSVVSDHNRVSDESVRNRVDRRSVVNIPTRSVGSVIKFE